MGLNVKISVRGSERVRKFFQETPREMRARIAEDLYDWCDDFLVERVRLNTPIRTGRLRRSLEVTPAVIRGNRVSTGIQSTANHALRMHEAEYQLGPVSRVQPGQPEGGVGRKYVTRVLRYHARSLRLIIGGSVTRTIRKLYPESGRVRQLR